MAKRVNGAWQGYEKVVLDAMNATTGWTVLGNDTTNLATANNRVIGTKSVEFDKADGAANTKLAGVSRTIDNNLDGFEPTAKISWLLYVSAVTNIDYTFIRIGSDSSNYSELRFADSSLVAGWNICHQHLGMYTSTTGTACDLTDVDYLVVGVAFDAETNTLADIAIDEISIEPGNFTD